MTAGSSDAVVGASSNPSRASNFVMTYLKSSVCDFELYPINPRETEIYGIDQKQFMRLQFEDPSFGLAIMRTITRRLIENVSRTPKPQPGRRELAAPPA